MKAFLAPLVCEGRFMRLSFTKTWTWIVGAAVAVFLFGFRQEVPDVLRDALLGLLGLHGIKKIPAVRGAIDAPTRADERYFLRGQAASDDEEAIP